MRWQEFAEMFDIQLAVLHRPMHRKDGLPPWYCSFPSLDLKDGNILTSMSGDGETPGDAIRDYLNRISGEHAVVFASSKDMRREMNVPQLEEGSDDE